MSIFDSAFEAFQDRFSDILHLEDDSDLILNEGAELPQYWEDDISELADSLVPIYISERVKVWAEDGYPEVSDTGLIDGVTAVEQIMAVALYERYSAELWGLADTAGFNEN